MVDRKYTKVKMTFRDGTPGRPATPLQGEHDFETNCAAAPEGLPQGREGPRNRREGREAGQGCAFEVEFEGIFGKGTGDHLQAGRHAGAVLPREEVRNEERLSDVP